MTAASASTHRVLIVDDDARVRRALAELIRATDGFAVAAVERTTQQSRPSTDATVAIVVLASATDHDGLTRVTELAEHMPVVAVCIASSAATAAANAGAVAFQEMDGNTDALIATLRRTDAAADEHVIEHPPTTDRTPQKGTRRVSRSDQ